MACGACRVLRVELEQSFELEKATTQLQHAELARLTDLDTVISASLSLFAFSSSHDVIFSPSPVLPW